MKKLLRGFGLLAVLTFSIGLVSCEKCAHCDCVANVGEASEFCGTSDDVKEYKSNMEATGACECFDGKE